MTFEISEKQSKILQFPHSKYSAIICDGAVRSGKTSIMTVAFIDWAMREFSGQRFGICGKTVGSATENIIKPYMLMSYARKRYTIKWRRSDKLLEVRRGAVVNWFEVFGGKDESSYMLIQGRTLAGVLLDEVVLMPESFVNQALARCSVNGARLWFSCNPGNPSHWFYEDWIKRHNERNALYLHFSMEDNPGLSKETLDMYRSTWEGVFYQRYVLGEWVAAEGLVYPMYDNTVETVERSYTKYYISIDFGSRNPTAMLLWGLCDGVWYAIREFYHSGRETNQQKTVSMYYADLERLAGDLPIRNVIVDPSAAALIDEINQHKKFHVWGAKNDVIDGIQHTAQMLSERKILFNDCCERTIGEFELYSWDDKAAEDAVIKDNDHCLAGDALVDTIDGPAEIKNLVGKNGFVHCVDGGSRKIGRFHDVRMTQTEAEVFEITLSDGRSVKATADHPILTRRGWVAVKDLRTDDEIACIGGLLDGDKVQRRP